MRFPKPFPVYPLLVAVAPVLSLWGHNIQELDPGAGNRALWVAVCGALVVWALWGAVTRSWYKSAILATWFWFLFYSYGIYQTPFEGKSQLGLMIRDHRILLPIWGILFLDGSYLIHKYFRGRDNFIRIINAIFIFLLIIPLYQLGYHQIRSWYGAKQLTPSAAVNPISSNVSPTNKPDIYLIILDSYTRADVLQEVYGFDNQTFEENLSSLGFQITPCSLSNYGYTALSLGSMLNMDYLDNILDDFSNLDKHDLPRVYEVDWHNSVRTYLESIGYTTVSIVGYQPIAWTDSDVYYPTNPSYIASEKGIGFLSQFERMLLRATALKPIIQHNNQQLDPYDIPSNYVYEDLVRAQWYTLEKINEIKEIPGPKFVFIHINYPHPPFMFHPDGSLIDDPKILSWNDGVPWEETKDEYVEAVQYVNNQIFPYVKQLTENPNPPIVILQGDHGYDTPNRLAIFNSFFVPDSIREKLYPAITPVNTFRIILNELFRADYPILEDKSFMSPLKNMLDVTPYQEIMPDCQP